MHSCKLCSVRRSKVGESNLNEPCHNCGLPSAFGANLFESIQKVSEKVLHMVESHELSSHVWVFSPIHG